MLLLENVQLLYAAVRVVALVVPRIGGVMLLEVRVAIR